MQTINKMAYTKLHSSILGSTIWQANDRTRIVWITMLALADRNGEVQASIPGLARFAGVPLPDCEEAINKFLSPDPYSRTPDDEGRRIEKIDGGWALLNHAKYRDMASKDDSKESAAKRQRRHRERVARNASVTPPSRSVTPCHAPSRSVTVDRDIADADADSKIIPPTPLQGEPKPKGPLQLRAESIMRRRPETPLTSGEARAFSKNRAAIEATSEDDWKALERFYKEPQEKTFARKDLGALINNWNGEIDRAKRYFASGNSSFSKTPKLNFG